MPRFWHGSEVAFFGYHYGPSSVPPSNGFTPVDSFWPGASVPHETRVPQELQPVTVRLARQQLRGALPHSLGVFAPEIATVVQEVLEQHQVVLPQLAPQEEVIPKPAVEVLNQAAGANHMSRQLLDVGTHPVITPSQRLSQRRFARPAPPVARRQRLHLQDRARSPERSATAAPGPPDHGPVPRRR